MLGGNMNTVPQIEYDDEKDINILKGQLIEIKKKLLAYDDVEEILYDAIEEQNWFTFKNKPFVVFDRRTGFLFPNFNHVKHVAYREWNELKNLMGLTILKKGDGKFYLRFFIIMRKLIELKVHIFLNKANII